jgi:hypothetical protein
MEAAPRTLCGKVHDATHPGHCSICIEKTTIYWGTRCALSHNYRF